MIKTLHDLFAESEYHAEYESYSALHGPGTGFRLWLESHFRAWLDAEFPTYGARPLTPEDTSALLEQYRTYNERLTAADCVRVLATGEHYDRWALPVVGGILTPKYWAERGFPEQEAA